MHSLTKGCRPRLRNARWGCSRGSACGWRSPCQAGISLWLEHLAPALLYYAARQVLSLLALSFSVPPRHPAWAPGSWHLTGDEP